MSRRRKKAQPVAPRVHHPFSCVGGCGGSGVISQPATLVKHGNGGTSFYHSLRCPGTPLQTSAPQELSSSDKPIIPAPAPVDHKQLAAGEGRQG